MPRLSTFLMLLKNLFGYRRTRHRGWRKQIVKLNILFSFILLTIVFVCWLIKFTEKENYWFLYQFLLFEWRFFYSFLYIVIMDFLKNKIKTREWILEEIRTFFAESCEKLAKARGGFLFCWRMLKVSRQIFGVHKQTLCHRRIVTENRKQSEFKQKSFL